MIRMTLIAIACTFAIPAGAGGPILPTEEAETTVQPRDHTLLAVIVGLAVAAIVLGNGSDRCTTPDPVPAPDGGC